MRIGRREALRLLAAAGAGALGAGAGIGRGPLGPRPARAGVGNIAAGAPGCGRVALIFNIGAGYDPALSVIDTLIAYGTPATMFMMGWWVDWTPDTARYIANQGFPVGSHGNLPPELTGRSDDDVKQDIWAAEAAFLRTLGYGPAPYMTAFGGAS
ncbi:MAG: polysaccharide deacetylase family protein, partial [Thermomicrobiales bacterium]|nr:polysaccharide deacetylase family protein [Thermomicrobiales bacterium]